MSTPTTYVALLRGINVGIQNRVSMADLKTVFEGLGFGNVTTYINSGNIIFTAPDGSRAAVEKQIETALDAKLQLPVSVLVRNLKDMHELMRHIPKEWTTRAAELKCNVLFLRGEIDQPEIMQQFKPKDGIEVLQYTPGALLWSADWATVTKTNMVKIVGSPLYKSITIRLISTTRKIYEIMQATAKSAASRNT
jgi:uncharacterized protein (DUF1697 family)